MSFSTRKAEYVLSAVIRLAAHTLSSVLLLNHDNLGTAIARSIPSIAMTKINSTNVKPPDLLPIFFTFKIIRD